MHETQPMNDATLFEPHRRFLRGLAYRMLGSVSEAEDVVQDTWLRWCDADVASVIEPRAFLAQIATRLCLDRIKSAQRQREQYVGVWLPEPLVETVDQLTEPAPPAEAALELAQDVSLAFLLMLQRLSPLERAVFLLHEVFDWSFDEVAQALGRSNAACRQLASRARSQVKLDAARPSAQAVDPQLEQQQQALSAAFAMALRGGNIAELAQTLASDVVFMSDGGGRVNAVPKPVQGADRVAKMLVGFARLWEREGAVTAIPARINGHLGAMLFDAQGQIVQTIALAFNANAQIESIYVVRNPDKLRHIGARTAAGINPPASS